MIKGMFSLWIMPVFLLHYWDRVVFLLDYLQNIHTHDIWIKLRFYSRYIYKSVSVIPLKCMQCNLCTGKAVAFFITYSYIQQITTSKLLITISKSSILVNKLMQTLFFFFYKIVSVSVVIWLKYPYTWQDTFLRYSSSLNLHVFFYIFFYLQAIKSWTCSLVVVFFFCIL